MESRPIVAHHSFRAEGVMWVGLLIGLSLVPGQADSAGPGQAPAEAPAAKPAPPPPDRWLLMRELQGTWPGWLLDGNRAQVSGWTDMSFTASSAEHSQLPM